MDHHPPIHRMGTRGYDSVMDPYPVRTDADATDAKTAAVRGSAHMGADAPCAKSAAALGSAHMGVNVTYTKTAAALGSARMGDNATDAVSASASPFRRPSATSE